MGCGRRRARCAVAHPHAECMVFFSTLESSAALNRHLSAWQFLEWETGPTYRVA